MKPVTIALSYNPAPYFGRMVELLRGLASVEAVIIVTPKGSTAQEFPGCSKIAGGTPHASAALEAVLAHTNTKYLLVMPKPVHVVLGDADIERMLRAAGLTNAGLTYADFYEDTGEGKHLHPLNDYQPGSIRDGFDFGPVLLFSSDAIRESFTKCGSMMPSRYTALYDLRLKVSVVRPLHHVPEPLCLIEAGAEGEGHFDYVDPRNAAVQKEMEAVFTDYLKRIDAYMPPDRYREVAHREKPAFPVEASVIIPVLNRKATVADAVKSALSQRTDFPFNVIVIDNHSTDGTTDGLARLAAEHRALRHVVPSRTDLGIGGCWNEGLYSADCGRYAVQLDSDDLYSGTGTLQRIVDMLRTGRYGMVVGSYSLVDFDFKEIPPGLIDHREWTDDNGRNNALRINGLGAPRAFDTALIRSFGFLNVSYGEDYAAALRVCREYRIGRIYDSLYLCRRWPGNTDAGLSIEQANRNDAFKDAIRTKEIAARQEMNRGERTWS